jgi:hypothetical protein
MYITEPETDVIVSASALAANASQAKAAKSSAATRAPLLRPSPVASSPEFISRASYNQIELERFDGDGKGAA